MSWALQQGQTLGINLFWYAGEGPNTINLYSADEVLRRIQEIHRLHAFWILPENQAATNWAWIVEAAEADPNNRFHGQHFSKYDYYLAIQKMRRANQLLAASYHAL